MRAALLTLAALAACTPPSTSDDAGAPDDDAGAPRAIVDETEPNDGELGTDPDALPVGATASGAIGAPGDIDLFLVPTEAGRVYRATATPRDGAPLNLRLTVLDAGRDGDPPGEDYVRLAHAPAGPAAELEFLAFGAGGHIVAVRDVDAANGGADRAYTLIVESLARADVLGAALSAGGASQGALRHAGAVALHELAHAQGDDLFVDAIAAGEADLRLFVHSDATGSWFARNDDGPSGLDPRVDVPLLEEGPFVLVVENVDEDATDLTYALDL